MRGIEARQREQEKKISLSTETIYNPRTSAEYRYDIGTLFHARIYVGLDFEHGLPMS